jgi:hypothetical protein
VRSERIDFAAKNGGSRPAKAAFLSVPPSRDDSVRCITPESDIVQSNRAMPRDGGDRSRDRPPASDALHC